MSTWKGNRAMCRRLTTLALLALIVTVVPLLSVTSVAAQPAEPTQVRLVELVDAIVEFPKVTIVMRVTDGSDIVTLEPRDFTVYQNGLPLGPPEQLDRLVADAETQVRTLSLNSGQTTKLCAVGPTVAVVLDLPAFFGQERIALGKAATWEFLNQLRALETCLPAAIGLYVPIGQPDEQVQQGLEQGDAEGYTLDLNAALNAITESAPRQGRTTNLYAALQEAIDDSSRIAAARGGAATVLVVSDGGDGISREAYEGAARLAGERGVKVAAFDVSRSGSFLLNELAASTGGEYQRTSDTAAAVTALQRTVSLSPSALYRLSFTTTLRDNGQSHAFTVKVNTPSGELMSEDIPFTMANRSADLPPLPLALLWHYVPVALPTVLVLSLTSATLLGIARLARRRSLPEEGTR